MDFTVFEITRLLTFDEVFYLTTRQRFIGVTNFEVSLDTIRRLKNVIDKLNTYVL